MLFVRGHPFPAGLSESPVAGMLVADRFQYRVKSCECQSQIDPETNMIHVTPRAAAHIAARGGHVTLFSRRLSS
jgi:hypothetical protein